MTGEPKDARCSEGRGRDTIHHDQRPPPRLYRVIPDAPLYFVTFCTRDRKPIQPISTANEAFHIYAVRALNEFNTAVGRYVIMPDHIHLFVRIDPDISLAQWVGGLKRAISVALQTGNHLWQPGFFDHVLRSDESYAEKWVYVRDNPVRAGFVSIPKIGRTKASSL
jgi:REP element-mobilizing transposase RayT